jgi:hypothetical protein
MDDQRVDEHTEQRERKMNRIGDFIFGAIIATILASLLALAALNAIPHSAPKGIVFLSFVVFVACAAVLGGWFGQRAR